MWKVAIMRSCSICDISIDHLRMGAKTCSPKCRKRLERENQDKRDISTGAYPGSHLLGTHEKRWQVSHLFDDHLDLESIKRDMRNQVPHFRLLDLCCCAGGASVGYALAGFEVVGVDIEPQPDYPFEFVQMDATRLDYDFLMSFDAIHASPPCQAYSRASVLARRAGKKYPDLYLPIKRMLIASGKPYIIENVLGSPAKGIRLYGDQFDLGVIRERIFESNIVLKNDIPRNLQGSVKTGEYVTVAGRNSSTRRWGKAMGIHWTDSDHIREAIPPAFTHYLGKQMYEKLGSVTELSSFSSKLGQW